MFRTAVAVLFTAFALAGCQANVPPPDKAGEDGTAALAVGAAATAAGTSESSAAAQAAAGEPGAQASSSGGASSASSRNVAGTASSAGGPPDAAPRTTPSSRNATPAESQSRVAHAQPQAQGATSGVAGAAGTASALTASGVNDAPAAPLPPAFKLVTVPAGTTLNVTLSNAVGSDTSNIEDSVRGKIAADVVIDGLTAIPAGSDISGSVTDAQRSGRVKGRAAVAFRFDRLEVRDETSRIQTSSVAREADADTRGDVKKGGIGAGIGAIVGGVTGGKKGAAIGAGVGGAGTVMATRGKEVHLSAGSRVRVTLRDALEVRVPIG